MNKENRLIYVGRLPEAPPAAQPEGPQMTPEQLQVFKQANRTDLEETQKLLIDAVKAKKDDPKFERTNAAASLLLQDIQGTIDLLKAKDAQSITVINLAIATIEQRSEEILEKYIQPDKKAASETEPAKTVEKAKEDKAAKARSAIDGGWERSGEVDDYDNETISLGTLTVASGAAVGLASPVPGGTVIGAGLGAVAGALDFAPEILTKGLNKTRHLYSGVISGIKMAGRDTETFTGDVEEEMSAESRTDRTLDSQHIEAVLEEAGIMLDNESLNRPEFTRIKGYVLGLLYGAKQTLEAKQYEEYKKALEGKINKKFVRSLAATFNKKAEKWLSFAGAGVEEALKKVIKELPTPDEWLAAQEAEATGPSADAQPKVRDGRGDSDAEAGGASGTRAKKRPSGSKERTGAARDTIDKGISARTRNANKKLMEKWLKSEQEFERYIKNELGYKPEDKPDYGSNEFAEKVKAFQKKHGLDMQDGVIGDQTMTAILQNTKELQGEKNKPALESYFKDKKVQRREAEYYTLRGSARSAGGRKRAAETAPAAPAPATAATPATGPGREPTTREEATTATAPAAAPAAAPAPAPAAEKKEKLEVCGKYCQIIEGTLQSRNLFDALGNQESVKAIVNEVTQKLARELYFDLHNDYVHIESEALKKLVYNRLGASNDYLLVGVQQGFSVDDLARKLGTKIEVEYIPQAKKLIESYHLGTKKPTPKEIREAVDNAFGGPTPEAKLGRLYNWMRKTLKDIKPKYMPSLDGQALLSRYVTDKNQENAKSSIATIFEQEINNVAREKAERDFKKTMDKNKFR